MPVSPHDPLPETDAARNNVESLIRHAYRPAAIDPDFRQRMQERMLAVAREGLAHRRGWRQRSGLILAAAVLVTIGLVWWNQQRQPAPAPLPKDPTKIAVSPAQPLCPQADPQGPRLTARPAPAEERPITAVGTTIQTTERERRLLHLADGSAVFVRESTRMQVLADRDLELTSGEVYVEVAEDPGHRPFLVRAGERIARATGTRFCVRRSAAGSAVEVFAGRVEVAGRILGPGQYLAADSNTPVEVGRAAKTLDWTRDLLTARSRLVPASANAGGTLRAQDPWGQAAGLDLRRYVLDVHIEDGVARTTVDATWFNPGRFRLEGTFLFPLPAEASLSRLAMYVDGRLMEGGIAERDHARNVYESIVHRQKDPALLEWVDGTTFRMRVFPIEPRQEKRLILSYTQILPSVDGRSTYRFPAPTALGTVAEWSCRAVVKNGASLQWSSPSHALTPAPAAAPDLILTAQAKAVRLDRDLVLVLDVYAGDDNRPRVAGCRWDGDTYQMVRGRLDVAGGRRHPRRDWVVLAEMTADRDPLLARTQIEFIKNLLERAHHEDTLSVIAVNHQVTVMPGGAVPNLAAHRTTAEEFLATTHLLGALDLEAALQATAQVCRNLKAPQVLHLGSALPVLGAEDRSHLVSLLPADVPYIGVAVGRRYDRAFLSAAATRSGGWWTSLQPDEEIAWRSFELLDRLDGPRLLDLEVRDAAGGIWLCPNRTLAWGEELLALRRVAGAVALPERVTVSATVDGKPFQQEWNLNPAPRECTCIPRLWGRAEIDRLVAADANANHDRIVALSRSLMVMSPFTSLLVLETEDQYQQFKIDRGRQDPWARYDLPATIPVVVEPDQDGWMPQVGDREGRRPLREVLASVVIRGRPALLTNQEFEPDGNGLNPRCHRPFGIGQIGPWPVMRAGVPSVSGQSGEHRKGEWFQHAGVDLLIAEDLEALAGSNAGYPTPYDPTPKSQSLLYFQGEDGTHRFGTHRFKDRISEKADRNFQERDRNFQGRTFILAAYSNPAPNKPFASCLEHQRQSILPARYHHDDRHFTDLLSYAPGLNTRAADVAAVVETEAELPVLRGTVDAAAKVLIDRARSWGWVTITLRQDERILATITAHGDGRFVWQRTTEDGLVETAVCDGRTWWLYYPDLGLAAERTYTHHHLKELAAMIPWWLPTAEDLSRGCRVQAVASDTIEIHPLADGRKRTETPAYERIRFGADGRIVERLWLRGDRRLMVCRIESNGQVEIADCAPLPRRWHWTLGAVPAGQEPALTGPNPAEVVILPLPWRTGEVVEARLRRQGKNLKKKWDEETYRHMAAVRGSNSDAWWVFHQALQRITQGDARLGWQTLAFVCRPNMDWNDTYRDDKITHTWNLAQRYPNRPVVAWMLAWNALRQDAEKANLVPPTDMGFWGRLTAIANLRTGCGSGVWRDASKREQVLAFARDLLTRCQGTRWEGAAIHLVASHLGTVAPAQVYDLLRPVVDRCADPGIREAMAFLAQAAGRREEAEQELSKWWNLSGNERLPDLGHRWMEVVQACQSQTTWRQRLTDMAKAALERKNLNMVLDLAWRVEDAGWPEMAEELAALQAPVATQDLEMLLARIGWEHLHHRSEKALAALAAWLAEPVTADHPDLALLAAKLAGLMKKEEQSHAWFKQSLEFLVQVSQRDGADAQQVDRIVRAVVGRIVAGHQDRTYEAQTSTLASAVEIDRLLGAIDCFRRLVPGSETALTLAAESLQTLGRPDLADAYRASLLSDVGRSADPWRNRARTLVQTGDLAGAQAAWAKAIARESTNPEILAELAQALEEAGRPGAADQIWRRIADGRWQDRFASTVDTARRRFGR